MTEAAKAPVHPSCRLFEDQVRQEVECSKLVVAISTTIVWGNLRVASCPCKVPNDVFHDSDWTLPFAQVCASIPRLDVEVQQSWHATP